MHFSNNCAFLNGGIFMHNCAKDAIFVQKNAKNCAKDAKNCAIKCIFCAIKCKLCNKMQIVQ